MNRGDFDVLVAEVERQFQGRPQALQWRVALWAAIGYAGLLVGPVLVLVLAGLCFVGAVHADSGGDIALFAVGALILFGGGWSVARVLWVRLEPPEGARITREAAPELHRWLDELRGQLRCGQFHEVVAVPDCNAAVARRPRLGVFGWPRHYLLLGLPLMEGLSTPEFRAVLAHEFAHLSRDHARFGQWIYRLRNSWEQVFARLSQPHVRSILSIQPLVRTFVEWFWPRFNAHAFVLSRAYEYEADAVAAQLGGAPALALSLMRFRVLFNQIDEKFWPDLWRLATREATAPAGLFMGLREVIRAPAAPDARRWMAQGFQQVTTNADTHPCLTDRLRALQQLPTGAPENLPDLPVADPSAADILLGPARVQVTAAVEEHWRKTTVELWRERHLRAAAQEDRLQRLATAVPDTAGDADALWDQTNATMDLQGLTVAEPMLRRILELNPRHAGANFHLGRHLVQKADPAAEPHLECVMELNDEGFGPASELLHQLFRATGQTAKLRALEARLDQRERDRAAAREERSSVNALDTLIPHGLTEEELASIRTILMADAEIIAADLGRKELKHFPKQRLFLLSLHVRRNWLGFVSSDRAQEAVNRILPRVKLPGRMLVFGQIDDFAHVGERLAQVQGARIYTRAG